VSDYENADTLEARLAAHLEPMPKKDRMKIDRHGMAEQEALQRARNFAEVNLGYTEQLAILEADRCLQCPKP
jgi:glutamate synthase (NADPH/NADH) small chain